MCDPVTLTIAAAAVAATGQIVGGIGAKQQADYSAKVNDQNARLANEQAADSITNTNLEAQRRRREQAQMSGRQDAAMAANGVSLDFGSAVDVQKDTAMFGAEDVAQISKAGAERTKGFEISSANYRSQAEADRAQGKGALLKGIFGAVSSALGGASQVSGMGGFGGGGSGPKLGTNRAVVGRGGM